MTHEEITQHMHYQPVKKTTVCGFMKLVAESNFRNGVLLVKKTSDLELVTCSKCRQYIRNIVLSWGG